MADTDTAPDELGIEPGALQGEVEGGQGEGGQDAGEVQKLAMQGAKKWVMGIEGGLIAMIYGAPVALLIANIEWIYHSRNKAWPMPFWEKVAIVMCDLAFVVGSIMLASIIAGIMGSYEGTVIRAVL